METKQAEKSWDQRAEELGKRCAASIEADIARLRAAREEGDDDKADAIREELQEGALSVSVRCGWQSPGDRNAEAEEYQILLGTGGPAVRIYGRLGQFNEPEDAIIQVQDWFQPWTDYRGGDRDAVLEYARLFYFGE